MTTPHPPKPGPRPGVVAGGVSRPTAPTPTAQPAARPAVTIPAASDPAEWGRVDESGNAYVKTTDGERLIGSWQAGTPAEGLAHYGARFDDLVVEVINLETRLQSHPTESAHLRGKAEQLRDSLDEAAVIGDVESLRTRLTKFMDEAIVAGERAKEEKQARRQAAIARKEELAAEAEDIAENSTEWKQAGDRIRAILDEWRTIRGWIGKPMMRCGSGIRGRGIRLIGVGGRILRSWIGVGLRRSASRRGWWRRLRLSRIPPIGMRPPGVS